MRRIVSRLIDEGDLPLEDLIHLLGEILNFENDSYRQSIHCAANALREKVFGQSIYKRGLIELSNYCKNDCFYCGIRRSNTLIERYRLEKTEVLDSCRIGYDLGFRTFVIQGGEDNYFSVEIIEDLVKSIRELYPDCAITLSLGEAEREVYQRWYDAGADRYLLRHETADSALYSKIHPSELSLEHRKKCLKYLSDIGFQVGTGFLVGLPGQTSEHLALDLEFIKNINPQMVGIGPFIPHKDTPLGKDKKGDVEMTLVLISIIRIMLPNALIPATTALATASGNGRKMGILAGANVVMPNLTPKKYRNLYALYENKISSGEEAAEGVENLRKVLEEIGCELVDDKGDYKEVIVNKHDRSI